jgi:hypothetical protein
MKSTTQETNGELASLRALSKDALINDEEINQASESFRDGVDWQYEDLLSKIQQRNLSSNNQLNSLHTHDPQYYTYIIL